MEERAKDREAGEETEGWKKEVSAAKFLKDVVCTYISGNVLKLQLHSNLIFKALL